MGRRLLTHLTFWPLMTLIIASSLVAVLLVYLPLVALKAVWTALQSLRTRAATPAAAPHVD